MRVQTTKTTRTLLAYGVAATAIAAAGQATAQQAARPESAGPPTVQEVVVTANKRAEKLHDVAMGVTALQGGALDAQQSVSFLDYAPLIPSLSIESTQPGETRLTLRGENTGGVGSTTAVYIDESPFGSSNALANGSITTGDFDTFDLQRVEVLRGPQGTLYGASTEGGLIKFVQNAPNLNRFQAAGEAGLEGVEHGQTVGDFKAMANLPLLDGKAALRLVGYNEDLPGWINDPQLKEKYVNSGGKYGLRASFLYRPTDTLSFKISAVSQLMKTGAPPSIDVVGAGLSPASPPPANQLQPTAGLTQTAFQNQYTKDRIENYSGTAVWNPGPVTVTSVTSFGILKLSTLQDLTLTEAAPGLTYGYYFDNYLYGGSQTPAEVQLTGLHKFTQEVRIASKASDKLEWQVGGFFTREDTVIHQVIETNGPLNGLPPPGSDLLKAAYTEWAGFGDATYHFLPQFDVEAGARWSTNTQRAVTTNYTGLLTTGGAAATQSPFSSTGSDFTYSVAPRWHVNKDTLVYARVATGYRPGGPNDIPAGVPGVPLSYGSDTTFNYEVGLRTDLLQHRLSIDVAAFHIDWSNIQLFEVLYVNSTPYGINGNGGDARSQGLEWTIGLFPVHGLSLNWTGAYTDAVMTSISKSATIAASPGDFLPYVPKWQTSLDAQYEWNLTATDKGFVGGTYSFEGSRYSNFYTDGSPGDGHVRLPSYQTVAVRGGVENDRWRFEVYAKNLTDARGITSYTSSGAVNNGGSISIIQPLTIGAVLSVKY